MSNFPSFKGAELIRALHWKGFSVTRIKGSHHFLKHPDGRCTVVPVHRGETIGRGLMARVLKDCELSRDDIAPKPTKKEEAVN